MSFTLINFRFDESQSQTEPTMSGTLSLPIFTVDAFTSVPFSGNPAAVCLDGTDEVDVKA